MGHSSGAGDDIGGPPGTPVMAMANGVVSYAQRLEDNPEFTCKNWGSVIVIAHEGRKSKHFSSVYAHIEIDENLAPGQRVKVGQVIGTIKRFERNGKPCWRDHLHFSVVRQAREVRSDVYPDWLVGYLPDKAYPGSYCDPYHFLTEKTCVKTE